MSCQLRRGLVVFVFATGCDGTLAGLHDTRGTLPVLYPEKAPPETHDTHENEPSTIRAQHLLVMYAGSKSAPPTVTRSKAEAKARAEEALKLIRDGANVDEVIDKYSDEPGAAARHGDLGSFARKMMVKKFSDAAFKLKIGEVSDVVETEFGFHVIRRTE